MRRATAGATLLRRFARDERGAYAVEFAMISGIFITSVIALFQFMLVFMARDSLESALQAASRKLLTGSFQQANAAAKNQAEVLANLKSMMCGTTPASGLITFACSDMKVDVSAASSFTSSSSTGSAVDGTTRTWTTTFGTTYTCPGPASTAVIRVAVKFPIIASGLAFGLSDFSDGSILLQSAAVFRVEQYQSGTSGAC